MYLHNAKNVYIYKYILIVYLLNKLTSFAFYCDSIYKKNIKIVKILA